ncbi:MAG: tetratricopeptide repeat protein [Gemmatimonadaceae bacterium]
MHLRSDAAPAVVRIARGLRAASLLAALSCAVTASACASQLRDDPARLREAQAALRAGEYDRAIALYTELAAKPDASATARRGLLRALSDVGKYAEAEEAGRRFTQAASATPAARPADLLNALGEVLALRGQVAGADSAFAGALAAGASDSLAVRANLGALRAERGDRAAATAEFDRLVAAYNRRGGRLSSAELIAVGNAARFLGTSEPQMSKDALKAYDEAFAADSTDLEARVRVGELFLEKYNSTDARDAFAEVLRINPRHPRALLGSARRLYFDGEGGADSTVRRALEVNPNLVVARAFSAALSLDLEDYAKAATEAERALQVNPASLEALSVLAAARYMRGDRAGFEEARRRVLARNPRYAELYNTLAELSGRNRLYRQAADFARQAIDLDSASWRGFNLLGTNQLRIGEIDAGRKSLETSFAGDPYHIWTKNTLDLLDTFKDYTETSTERFRFVIEKKDAELLSLYLGELLEDAYTKLAARYGYRPATPIRLELYRSHADFSVRTVGLAGIGALGVSFGNVLAMDSPAARKLGEFNWGSTAWHELTHTFTLGMTDHKVPRWFSEGLSVYEERRARPGSGWGADLNPAFLSAYKAGKLVPVSRFNDGFVHPEYPEQVIFSYYQASLVCDMIEAQYGERALVDMLGAYKNGLATADVFRQVLKTDLAAFDGKFDAYMKERFAGPLAAVRAGVPGRGGPGAGRGLEGTERVADRGDFGTQLTTGRSLFEEGKKEEAIPYLERAKTLFPQYAGEDSPYWFLARIHKEKGELRQAADELAKLTGLSESNYAANLEQAAVLEQLGDAGGAAAALERAIYISPFDPIIHTRLAELAARAGKKPMVVRERRAVLALDPVDKAGARYELARAYYEAGDAAAARREVLRALEEAPNFEKAQELLLTLQRAGGRPGAGGS